ncbi:MAG: 50S ribosomal protein L21 [Chloroflexi bacterium RBG_16_70_13]|nr:MAG: 50S ribosomal protein L21 [Chloroflexi bacterium RBG_16_70_13]
MYAVIETGGKQYRVEVGTQLEVELLEVSPGDAITLDRVLLVADGETAAIGRPLVENASVAAEVLRQARGEKLINFKYGPKTRRRVKKGHRQELTVLRISDIVFGGRSAAKDAAKAAEDRKTERQRLEEAARRQAEADAALAAKLKPAAPKATKADATPAEPKAAKPGRAKAAAKPAATADVAPAPEAPAPKPLAKSSKPAGAKTEAEPATDAAAEPTTEKPRRPRATKKDE